MERASQRLPHETRHVGAGEALRPLSACYKLYHLHTCMAILVGQSISRSRDRPLVLRSSRSLDLSLSSKVGAQSSSPRTWACIAPAITPWHTHTRPAATYASTPHCLHDFAAPSAARRGLLLDGRRHSARVDRLAALSYHKGRQLRALAEHYACDDSKAAFVLRPDISLELPPSICSLIAATFFIRK